MIYKKKITPFLLSVLFLLPFQDSVAEERTLQAAFEVITYINESGDANETPCFDSSGDPYRDIQHSPLINQCMVDICGAPSENSTTTLTDRNVDEFADRTRVPSLGAMEQSIDQAIEAERARTEAYLSRATSLLSGSSPRDAMDGLSPSEWDNIIHTIYAPYINVITNPYATRAQDRVDVNISLRGARVDGRLREQIEDYASKLRNQLSAGNWHAQIRHRAVSLEEAQDMLLSNYMRMAQDMKRKSQSKGFFARLFRGDEDTIKDKINDNIMNLRKLSYSEVIETSNKLRDVYHRTMDLPAQREALCSSGPCVAGAFDYMGSMDFSKILREIADSNEGNPGRQIKYDCRMQVLANQVLAPDPAQISAALQDVAGKFKKNVIAHFSEKSKADFNRIMREELQIRTAENKTFGEGTANRIKVAFDRARALSDVQASPEFQGNLTSGDIFNWIFEKNAAGRSVGNVRGEFRGDAFADFNPCDETRPTVGGDSFTRLERPEDGKKYFIQLSAHTCSHIHSGKGTVAHELGHLLSVLFSSGEMSHESGELYKKIRGCSNLGYRKLEAHSGNSSFPGDTIKSEEDTADLIAMLALQNDTDHKPSTCKTLRPSQNGNHYNHDTLLTLQGEHSSPPLRVIMEYIHRSAPLSDACKELTDKYKEELRFGRCF